MAVSLRGVALSTALALPLFLGGCGGTSSTVAVALPCAPSHRGQQYGTVYRGTELSARLPSGWKVLNATRNSLDLTTAAGDGLVVFYRVSHARGNGGYSPDAFRDMALSQSGVPFEDTALTEQGFSHATVHHLRSLGTVGMGDDTQWQFQETRLRARWQGHRALLRTRVAIHNEYQGTYSAVLSLIAAREDRWEALKPQLEAVERTITPRAVRAPVDLPRDNPLTDGRSAFWAVALPGRSLCVG